MKRLAMALSLCGLVYAQQGSLTDARLMGLAQAGVSEAELVRMVGAAQEIEFDLRPVATDAMMKAGVSAQVIRAMAAREFGTPSVATVVSLPTPSTSIATPPAAVQVAISGISEIGVYHLQNGAWAEMMPEVVNWKTGGVLKSLSTAGIVRGDVNGRLRGGTSRTRTTSATRLLVYCPEGTQVTEYQLIHLRTHSNSREFRTVTGGVLHVSGNSDRDDLPFNDQRIAPRMWTIALEALRAGEYGLLPPGAGAGRSASAQLGKMYTFTVAE
jgi:hypothetical protein